VRDDGVPGLARHEREEAAAVEADEAEPMIGEIGGDTWQSIELDCPPGPTRPWHLIVGVCFGTDLPVTDDVVSCTFGHSEWLYKMDKAEWEERIQPIIKPRIVAL